MMRCHSWASGEVDNYWSPDLQGSKGWCDDQADHLGGSWDLIRTLKRYPTCLKEKEKAVKHGT